MWSSTFFRLFLVVSFLFFFLVALADLYFYIRIFIVSVDVSHVLATDDHRAIFRQTADLPGGRQRL